LTPFVAFGWQEISDLKKGRAQEMYGAQREGKGGGKRLKNAFAWENRRGVKERNNGQNRTKKKKFVLKRKEWEEGGGEGGGESKEETTNLEGKKMNIT